MLEYRVESSDKYHIYKVKFEGEGESLRATCTCPAYKKKGLFCKHVAFLLKGDDSLIIEPSDKIEDLKKISENSELLEKAKTHKIYKPKKLKYVARLEGDLPNSWHEFTAENEAEAWESAKKLSEQALHDMKFTMENPPENPPEILEVTEYEEFMRKRFERDEITEIAEKVSSKIKGFFRSLGIIIILVGILVIIFGSKLTGIIMLCSGIAVIISCKDKKVK